jgi:hypothetical protein
MSNEAELQAMLNQPLDEVPTDRPLLQGLAELRLDKGEIKENNKKDGHNLNLEFSTQTIMRAIPDAKGNVREVQPGFKVFHTIALKKTEKYNPAENLAKLKEALTGSKTGGFGDIGQYVGLVCMAKLKAAESTNKETGQVYEPRTTIAQFVKKG